MLPAINTEDNNMGEYVSYATIKNVGRERELNIAESEAELINYSPQKVRARKVSVDYPIDQTLKEEVMMSTIKTKRSKLNRLLPSNNKVNMS